jgi:5-methylcytosine-specific restriction protein A
MTDWMEPIGSYLTREERADRYGGAKFGGIEPSRKTANVFLYSDPEEAEAFGYNFDGWNKDASAFSYTGEGQVGDQLFRDGNKALAHHAEDGRALRLFIADGIVEGTNTKKQRYIGAFQVDPYYPHRQEEAPDRNGDPRTVIVFRLIPAGDVEVRDSDRSSTGEPSDSAHASLVDIESHEASTFEQPGTQPLTAIRVESDLVSRYTVREAAEGRTLKRWRIMPPGELRPIFTDLYDPQSCELVEAKGTTTRLAIRQAIGQLYDYRRHLPDPNPRLSVLLPHRPSDDLLNLLKSCGISCIFETDRGQFDRVEAP